MLLLLIRAPVWAEYELYTYNWTTTIRWSRYTELLLPLQCKQNKFAEKISIPCFKNLKHLLKNVYRPFVKPDYSRKHNLWTIYLNLDLTKLKQTIL